MHHRLDVSENSATRRWNRALGLTGCLALVLMASYAASGSRQSVDMFDGTISTLDTDSSAGDTTNQTMPGLIDDSEGVITSSTATSGGSQSGINTVNIGMGCPEFQLAFDSASPGSATPFRSFTLTKGSGYAYVALHLSKLWLPRGSSVVLRAVEGFDTPDRTLNLSTMYPSGQIFGSVLAPPILAKEFRIEFYRDADSVNVTASSTTEVFNVTDYHTQCFGFVADSYYYVLMDQKNPIVATDESICAADNTKEAICYYADPTTRPAFLASRAVARLLIQKAPGISAGCTGWLLGNQGHVLTNHHCVATDAEASGTSVEFMAEADVCSDSVSCASWGACPGNMVAMSVELVHTDETLDYALLKLPSNGPQTAQNYGYLRLKSRAGVVGEQMYIPQHPLYEGKRIALVDDYASHVALLSLSATSCGVTGYSYSGDTQSGSSGSPVLSFADHGVVALHHCGEMCANTGVPAISILADLAANGIDVAAFDGVDDGSSPSANAARFPSFTPPDPVPVLPLTPRLTLNGAIILASGVVSIDQVEFTLSSDSDVAFDVMSVEISDSDIFTDLNGDCRATYLDSMIFLFPKGDTTPVFTMDDSLPDV
ncbi:hypothetical protein BBJ28_00022111, partial [Nothophytophthora sp. Chile5]